MISGFLIPTSFNVIFPDIIAKIGENVQKVTIPGFAIGTQEPKFRGGAPLKIAGDNVTYETLSMSFLLDQNLVIYELLLKWLKACTYPEDPKQYSNFVDRFVIPGTGSKEELLYRDLTVVSTSGTEPMVFKFKNVFPIGIGSIEYDTTYNDATIAVLSVNFAYTYFDIGTAGNSFSTLS